MAIEEDKPQGSRVSAPRFLVKVKNVAKKSPNVNHTAPPSQSSLPQARIYPLIFPCR